MSECFTFKKVSISLTKYVNFRIYKAGRHSTAENAEDTEILQHGIIAITHVEHHVQSVTKSGNGVSLLT